jgi:DNA-binding transcriptional LysR family regulator
MITYEELQQLVAFSETGTLAEVAQRFHISQPSITRNMKKLEKEFGVSLFHRTKNSVSFTDTGWLAAREASATIKQMDDMIQRVRNYDQALHTVSLGSCAAVPVTALNRQIMSSFPESTIVTNVRSVEELLRIGR